MVRISLHQTLVRNTILKTNANLECSNNILVFHSYRRRVFKKKSFTHALDFFFVIYLFKICSWHHKLSHLFSIHALFHCTSVHCWIVDKSRFLSLEKFESLWLVPLRCCELATLGAFFFLWPALTAYLWPNMDCKMLGCQILIQPKGVQFRFL